MDDVLFIEKLSIVASIGAFKWEKTIKQKLELDIEIKYNSTNAAKSDNLNDCLNYSDVSEIIINHFNKRHFSLVERVAQEVAQLLLNKFSFSVWVRIKVSKPGALAQARNVGIIVERSKNIKEKISYLKN